MWCVYVLPVILENVRATEQIVFPICYTLALLCDNVCMHLEFILCYMFPIFAMDVCMHDITK